MSSAVVFDDAALAIRIYSMSSGGVGTELTPSSDEGWLYTQSANLRLNYETKSTPKIGGTGQRHEILSRNGVLTINKWHNPAASTDDLLLAETPGSLYALRVYRYDWHLGETESNAHKYLLTFCAPQSGSSQPGNVHTISRSWLIGAIIDDS